VTIRGVEIAEPWFLCALLLAPLAWLWSRRSAGRVVFSSLRALPGGGDTWRTRIAWLPDALLALAVASLVIALAGPRKGDDKSRVHADGIAICMAVDVSGSMHALDLSEKGKETTRLDAVKGVFEQFVDARPDDAIGLVAFAAYADTRSPLTLDHQNLIAAAQHVSFANRGEDGTALGAGLALATERVSELRPREKLGRVVILLTDGVSNIHDIQEDDAIAHAVEKGVKVYTIGAGTNGQALVRVDLGDGRSQLMNQPVEIDEAMLQRIADRTGGKYFRATDHASLVSIYDQIDKLEKAKLSGTQFANYHYFYAWFAGLAMLLVIAAFALRGTVLRRLP